MSSGEVNEKSKRSSRRWLAISAVSISIALCVIAICVTVAVIYSQPKLDLCLNQTDVEVKVASDDIKWPSPPDASKRRYRFAGVACSQQECSAIGVQVLAEGGTAVDSSIAVALCIGVHRLGSSGIGGGGYINYYNRSLHKGYIIDYRETAPAKANSSMYENSTLKTTIGGGSIAVPGEVAGLWYAHQKFGRLPWSRLFQPSIAMARSGIRIDSFVARLLTLTKVYEQADEQLKSLLTNPETGNPVTEGDVIKLPKLADTYERIAEGGADIFYNGSLKDDIIADLNDISENIITSDDLKSYTVQEKEPLISVLKNGGFTVLSPPPPSGGLVLQYVLNILDGYNFTTDSVSAKSSERDKTATTYHRLVEAFKFGYAMRSKLGDEDYVNVTEHKRAMRDEEFCRNIRSKIMDDTTHNVSYYGMDIDQRVTTGTSQISILAGNGDAVSMTTTINFFFGSKIMGKRTGIIFNNEMDDFAQPGKPTWTDDAWTAPSNKANWIEPGKRPLSSTCPSIVLDGNGDVKLVTGGAGGSKIISAVAATIINNLWFKQTVSEAVSRPRLHHQLLPNKVMYEKGFPDAYLEELRRRGHTTELDTFPAVTDSSSVEGGVVNVYGDEDRIGGSDGF